MVYCLVAIIEQRGEPVQDGAGFVHFPEGARPYLTPRHAPILHLQLGVLRLAVAADLAPYAQSGTASGEQDRQW